MSKQTTKLTDQTILPLTCSRSGTCCFGKDVMLNPWELLQLSKEKKISPREFRDLYCDYGGIQLRFNGKKDNKEQQACSQYIDDIGCSVHLGRPLACRLYPLGRQIQHDKAHYMYQGDTFPCFTDCSEVLQLPKLTVGEYIKGQEANQFEKAQDQYLALMQNIADIAFELLLDTGLSKSGDKTTLASWREMGLKLPQDLAKSIGQDWLDSLMIPLITEDIPDPIVFTEKHNEILMLKAQEQFGPLLVNEEKSSYQELHEASVLMLSVALHLAKAIGAHPKSMSELWIETAKNHGAQE
ncbi:MAG: Fe-S-cluster containining protein [Glaciecola sp.]|jgi:Fe-S-cluster containining protein